ncbi:hypothetical protein LH435_13860 [Laribacter hongkongensis]|uniref:Uncharacterized protein n=1 Tax=Laribacter hongkongensis (strain HLHK9) TaxID=557598 RepID=C1DCH6_LARHH|nr:hypothetical protein [Laribacter hongkongensis]ACO75595.1 hypothetical protein LHK_02614 [Laribacter hongkongensis HLHK9]MCG8996378.1 hypothetical protein [Laribacter hongkongensis]MCG9011586.1 hypothetical protein [Laribacter hongkongensis]MCG9048019.1 hypothetical protein [Laribacter hongkongensis]MCG9075070.1 hypothetical protein [Laribacter hongkongensis]
MNSHQTPASQAGQGHGNTPTCLPRKWGRVIKSITFAIQPDIREQVELLARQRNVSMSIVLNDLLHVALESDTGLLDGLNAPSHTMLASIADEHGMTKRELVARVLNRFLLGYAQTHTLPSDLPHGFQTTATAPDA